MKFRSLVIPAAAVAVAALPATADAKPHGNFHWHGRTWNPYHGHGRLGQHWVRRNIHINHRGRLVFRATRHAGAGARLTGDQMYGKFAVRFRMDRGRGSKYVLLLWPHRGLRPEVDFAESWKNPLGEGRVQNTASYHPDMEPSHVTQWVAPPIDFSNWHSASVTWRPTKLVFKIDGHKWASYHGANVPHVPMHLAIQATRYGPGHRARLMISRVRIKP